MFPFFLFKLANKFWYLICVLVYLYSLADLLAFKRAVYYENDYATLNQDAVYLSICLRIDSSEFNCTGLTGEMLQVCNKTRHYFLYIENDELKSPNQILARFDELNLPPLFHLQFNVSKVLKKYLNFRSLCFVYQFGFQNATDGKSYFMFEILNPFKLKSKYFLHGERIPRFSEKIENLWCAPNFKFCNNFLVTVRQFQRKQLPAPYVSNCMHYAEEKFDFDQSEPIELRDACFQECLKARLRVSEFFYTELDNRTLKFRDNQNYDLLDANYVKKCKDRCSKTDCFYTFFVFYSLRFISQRDSLKYKIWKTNFTFSATEFISNFEFWLKFFALLLLFTRISFLSLILRLNYFASVRLKRKHLISVAKIALWVGLFSGVYFGCYRCQLIYRDFVEKRTYPYLLVQVPFRPAAFSHAVCKSVNSTEFRTLSLFEIENRTACFDSSVIYKEKFNVEVKNLKFPTERVFFSSMAKNRLEQCFTFDVFIEEPRYRSLLSLTALVINSTNFKLMYINQYNKSFTTQSLRLEHQTSVIEEEQLYLNCKDYRKEYETCDTKQHCIDKCYVNGYLAYYKKLPIGSVVYLDYFEEFQKRSLFFDFDHGKNKTIWKACKAAYEKNDCTVSNFFPGIEYDEKLGFKDSLTLSLYFLQVQVRQIMKFNFFDLTVIMLALYTALTGLSWPKLSHFLVSLINLIFKPQEKLNFRNLIFLVSLLGSIGHSYFVLKETLINSLYIDAVYEFEFVNYNKIVPTCVICLDTFNWTWIEDEPLTGNLLEEKTKHLNLSYLFKEIILFDQKAVKKHWKPNLDGVNDEEEWTNLILDHFFFLNYRCYQIRYSMAYKHARNPLINTIMEIKFNPNISHEQYLFIVKLDETDDFSSHFFLPFKENFRLYFNAFNNHYYNQYQTLTNPNLWLRNGYAINNVTLYLNQIREEFRSRYNRSTKLIPLYSDYFDLQIDDHLFDQFTKKYIKEKEDAGLLDLNYQRSLFETLIHPSKNNETGSLSLCKLFYAVETKITKSASLIQNMLVVAFVWFDIYIVDLNLKLISQFRMFFSIFKWKIIKKQILQIKQKIDSFFLERKSIEPILSLNNKNV